MQFLKNKHLIMAMFIAPVLAIIAYYSVDFFVSEKPHAAVQGNSYKLAARSNCRYKSGVCTLENGDIEVKLHANTDANNQLNINLSSVTPIQTAVISLVSENGTEVKPVTMEATTDQFDVWKASIGELSSDKKIIRLALNISDTLYYAEVTTIFIDFETSFSRENFSGETFPN